MSDNDIPVMDHDYDGIQEYDNPLPMWWLVTFYGTIIFGFLYWIHYEFGGGSTLLDTLKQDMAQVEASKKSSQPAPNSNADMEKMAAAGGGKEEGSKVYATKCAPCHGPQLQGSIGPNLTDEFWIHGKGTAAEIADLVRKGVTDKGMPAWEALLKPEEVQQVAVYVASMKGSNPPNPKAPQGNKVGN